jgi:hypothetical protein
LFERTEEEDVVSSMMNFTNATSFGPPPVWAFVVFSVSGFFCVAAVALSGFLLLQHLRHFTVPQQQRYIVRIIIIVPLYSLYSFFSMIFVSASVYLAILRDAYEAFAFLQFFKLCCFFVGGEEELSSLLAGEPPLSLPFPLHRWQVKLGPGFLRVIKLCILQYVIVRPLSSLAAIVCQAAGVYGEGEW